MNSKERKLVDLLKELKEEYNLIGIKTEFEQEGACMDELCRLKDVTSKADVPITLKIGGGENATGIKAGRVLGVSRIIAPMIESPFALHKFVDCFKKCYQPDELQDVAFGINIETVTGYRCFDEMMETPDFRDLDSIVCARGDMVGSMGKTPDYMDSDELQVMCDTLFKKVRVKFPHMENVLGGVLSPKSYPFISGLDQKAVDVYEARKVIYKIPEAYDKKAVEGFAKGLAWELLWCENKMEFFDFYAREDEGKYKSIKEAYDYAASLL